jgi:hypothetical protein
VHVPITTSCDALRTAVSATLVLQALASIECDTVMVVVSGAVSLTVSTHFKPAAAATAATASMTDASVDASADNDNVCLDSGASHKLAVIKAGEVFPAHVSSGSLLL